MELSTAKFQLLPLAGTVHSYATATTVNVRCRFQLTTVYSQLHMLPGKTILQFLQPHSPITFGDDTTLFSSGKRHFDF